MATGKDTANDQKSAPEVFIVDDDAAVREALSLVIAMRGWQPRPHASARAFLEAYVGQAPACLLLDLSMRGMNGAELLESLDGNAPRLPTIVITAHQDHPLARRAINAGACAVLAKPFRNEDVIRLVEDALSSPSRPWR